MRLFAWVLSAAIFFGAFIAARSPEAQGQTAAQRNFGISVQASPQIFATMCALDAAGLDADESALSEMPARLALRGDLLKMQGTATEALRQFYKDHVLESPAETLSRYITFALVAGPPPAFELPAGFDQLPPDVLTIDGFQKVLEDFYQEAHLDLRWAKIEPEYEPAVERYRASLRRIVTVSDAYLREISKPDGRSFTVYVEPLVGARTNFRNFGDRYAIVVGGDAGARANAIQHAYLHFMLDRFVLRQRPVLDRKSSLLNVAAAAPRLPMEYRGDFVAFTDECFVKAVELRLRHLTGAPLEAALQDADQSGYILVRPLVAGLQKFEKAEPAMSYYFPDLIAGIDFDAEHQRAQRIKFAAAQPNAEADEIHGPGNGNASELERWLAEGNREIANKDAAGATATFEAALAKYPNDARVEYGLAIASVISGDGDRAKELFEKVVSAPASTGKDAQEAASSDPSAIAWSHVYLGRIHDLGDERDLALNEYRAALAVNGAPEAARVAAQNGINAAYQPPPSAGKKTEPE
ncbi:MAG TPA: tetratricopeptide repeat protein [Verrucomicrobiae bacterium]|nr:tetratricopeptide repeat protein [Verrucomicrobiae bacterium]